MLSTLAGEGLAAQGRSVKADKMNYEFFATQYHRLMNGASAESLQDELPQLKRGLALARAVSAEHWTDSTPYDELAKQFILPDRVLDALGIAHPVDGGVKHTPAGLLHSYGYLFSQLQTAYGLKGKRWIEARLDERLGLRPATFSPFAKHGEFLSNVTAAFFRVLHVPVSVPGAAAVKPRARLAGTITEHVTWKTPQGLLVTRDVRTHLVDLLPLKDQKTTDVKLLIYEVVEGGKHRLVTGFPIDAGYAASLMRSAPVADTSFRPRYNLYVDPRWTVVAHTSEGFAPSK